MFLLDTFTYWCSLFNYVCHFCIIGPNSWVFNYWQVENTIRWRYGKDQEGNEIKESNGRIVRWSDGSMSLLVGQEVFDIQKTRIEGNFNHLFVQQVWYFFSYCNVIIFYIKHGGSECSFFQARGSWLKHSMPDPIGTWTTHSDKNPQSRGENWSLNPGLLTFDDGSRSNL